MSERQTIPIDMGCYVTYVDKRKALFVEDMQSMLIECSILLRDGTQEHAEKCADRVDALLSKMRVE